MGDRWMLAGCAAAAGLELVAAFLPQAVLVPLGLVTAFLALGYAVRRAVGVPIAGTTEEFSLSVAASLGVVVGTGLLLNLVPGGLTRTSWTLATGGTLLLASVVGLARGRTAEPGTGAGRAARTAIRPAYLLRGAAILALVGASVAVAVSSQSTLERRSQFTELGLAGTAHDVVTVRSHEPVATSYRLVVAAGGTSAATTTRYDLRLEPGATWQHALALSPARPVSVDLYRAGETEPYRHVALR